MPPLKATLQMLITSALAAILLTLAHGFEYPGSDMHLILPRMLQYSDPGLFQSDPYFSIPAKNYSGVVWLLVSWSKFFGTEKGVFLLLFLARTALFFGLQHLAASITKIPGNFPVILLFALNSRFYLLGNTLDAPTFHPQFVAFGFLVTALSFVVSGHLPLSALCLVVSSFFHPLIGLYGLVLLAVGAVQSSIRRAALPFIVVLVGFFFTVWPSIISGSSGSDGLWVSYVNVLTYFRAPWHFDPLTWGKVHLAEPLFAALAGIALVSCTSSICRAEKSVKAFFYVVTGMATLGLVNMLYLHVPQLVIGNFLKMGPLLLVFLWVLATRYLQQHAQRSHVICLIGVCASENLVVFSLFLFFMVWISTLIKKFWTSNKRLPYGLELKDLLVFFTIVAGIYFTRLAIVFNYSVIRHLTLVFITIVIIIPLFHKTKEIRLSHIASILLIIFFTKGFMKGDYPASFVLQESVDKDWAELCKVVHQTVPPTSCVIIPPELDNFQTRSGRCAFVSFKHFPFQPEGAVQWANRMIDLGIFPINATEMQTLRHHVEPNWGAYGQPQSQSYSELKYKYPDVDYCVVPKQFTLPFQLVFHNEKYKLYRIH